MKNILFVLLGIIIGLVVMYFYIGFSETKDLNQSISPVVLQDNYKQLVDEKNKNQDMSEDINKQLVIENRALKDAVKYLKEQEQRATEAAKKLKGRKMDGAILLADQVNIGRDVSKQWAKMEQLEDVDYKPEKDDWSYRAEDFLNIFLAENPLLYHINTSYFCDKEACSLTSVEFDVPENFHGSNGDKEWQELWRRIEESVRFNDLFVTEKIGGSNFGEDKSTRNKNIIFFKKG